MNEELQLALAGVISPERLEVILQGQRLLNDLGLTTADDELQQIFGLQDGISDNQLFVSRIEDCLLLAVGDSLRQYGITVAEHTPFAMMVGILHAVSQFEYYILPETLLDLTCGTDDSEVLLAGLVPLFSELQREEVLEYLTAVEASTIARIRQIASDHLALREVTVARPDDYHQRIRILNGMLRRSLNAHPQVVLQLAKNGIRAGLPVGELLEQALDDLDALKLEAAAREIVALVYFSDTPLDDIWHTTVETIRDYVDEYRDQVRMEAAAEDFYQSVKE